VLPPFLERVEIGNLTIGEASVDVILERHQHDVSLTVARRDGEVDISIVK
jgi:hypothetical protein